MRKAFAAGLLLFGFVIAATLSAEEHTATVDGSAPDFSLTGADGKTHSLSDFKGKWVVLEWVNFGCPFVRKHYDSHAMQTLQRDATAKGIVWLSICSSAPGKQGYFEGDELRERLKSENASPTFYLVDPHGTVGRMYGAKTTPDMFVINPEGKILYAGAIDDTPSTNTSDIPKATPYVRNVINAALAGKPAPIKSTKSYGCSVKYE